MTNDFRSAGNLHDEQIIEDLLAETGMNHPADTGQLKTALIHVRGLAHGPQPTPRGELAALLATLATGPTADTGNVTSLEAHRRKRHTRLVIAATALSLSLGAGAAAAAVNPEFRDTVQKTVTALVDTLTPAPNDRPPGTPAPVDAPAPATPGPRQPAPPGKAIPSGPPATPPAASDPQRDETVPVPQTNPGLNGSPAPGQPPAPVMPQPAVPTQPPEPPTTSTPPHQRATIPEPLPAAPATGNHK